MKHLEELGVGYWRHWLFAFQFGVIMVLVGLAVIIHAFIPYWFKTTGSDAIRAMAEVMNEVED